MLKYLYCNKTEHIKRECNYEKVNSGNCNCALRRFNYNTFANAETVTPTQAANQYGYNVTDNYQPEGAVNIAQTGQILYQYNADKDWYPASMSKLMTMYLTLEAVNRGDLSLDDKVKITDKHYSMSTLPELSNTKLYPGETYTIKELLQITVSNSSNAAALILGQEVSGNLSDFTDAMNKKQNQ